MPEIDYEDRSIYDGPYWGQIPFENVKLMQLTGLKDKDGRKSLRVILLSIRLVVTLSWKK